MNKLIRSLLNFSKSDEAALTHAFASLALRDLGFYVNDVAAAKYMADKTFPIADQAFLLENALNQCGVKSCDGGTTAEFFHLPWKSSSADVIGCSTIFESSDVTLCWFVVPPGRTLPLHDHPSMTVWQRVLFGKLKVTSVEKTEIPDEGKVVYAGMMEGSSEAVAVDGGITAISPSPHGGVLHELENTDEAKPALFVDIIAPPYYKAPHNHACTYYAAAKKQGGGEDALLLSCAATRESGLVGDAVCVGDTVILRPRKDYSGPAMDAFAYIQTN